MPAQRLTMRKTREILRLRWGLGRSGRETARSLDISPSTVADCLLRAELAALAWPLPDDLDDGQLEQLLYPSPKGRDDRVQPDFPVLYRELKRKGVTLSLLWQEYRSEQAGGYQYSQFCELYRQWRKSLDLVMRQEHRAGEKLFVDYAGPTVDVIDPKTGEVTEAAVFVATMAASNYTYTEAQTGQDIRSWIGGHIRALEFFGGAPDVIVPDNLKAGVKDPCFYEPDINPAFREMAEYYGAVVIPARPKKPRDKAKVENGVQQVERWVLAPLRNQRFFSLAELNRAIRARNDWLNDRPLSQVKGSRRSLFEELDRPALKPLPTKPYEVAEWRSGVGVGIDYHVAFEKHYYSVPYQLVGERVDIRATWNTIEILFNGRRIASHARNVAPGRYSTQEEHRPKSHQRSRWSPERLIGWAAKTGPSTSRMVQEVMERRPHPEQGFRSCLGILRLGDRYGADRLERACERALAVGTHSYRSVDSILKNGLDQQPLRRSDGGQLELAHPNIRGGDYYN